MKRGISPLLTTAILIGIIVLFFIISGSWFQSFSEGLIKTISEESLKQITCSSPNSNLEIDSVCYNTDNMILVLGTSNLRFEKFILSLDPNITITIETQSGLSPFEIRRISISQNSNDLTQESRNILNNLNIIYPLSTKIKVTPTTKINNENVICQNLILEKNIRCCSNSEACNFCFNDSQCTESNRRVCNASNRTCVECTNSNTQYCPQSQPYCSMNRCVECTENSHCNSGTCENNRCVQRLNCNDVIIGFNRASSFMDGEVVETSISSLVHVREYDINLSDNANNNLLSLTRNTNIGNFKFCYGNGNDARRSGNENSNNPDTCPAQNSFISDKKVTKIKAVVRSADPGYEHCIGKLFEIDISCRRSFVDCTESDCGFNRFIPTTGNYREDPIEDSCFNTQNIKEYFCTSEGPQYPLISCINAGATSCNINKCV